MARRLNADGIVLKYKWAIDVYNKAIEYGYKVRLDKPHGGYGWHMHLIGSNGVLGRLHIQIAKSAWDYLFKIINK